MAETRAEQITRLLAQNPGVTFAVPDAFYGHRPVYFTDAAYLLRRDAARSWLYDPEGYIGAQSEFTGWNLTTAPPSTPPWDVPQPWLLPAVTTGYSDPDDVIGSWTYTDGDRTYSYDVHRGGYLTPMVGTNVLGGSNVGAGLPPASVLASSPYQASQFHVSADSTPPTQSTTTPGSGGYPTTADGTPITGNANDRYLVNGTTYDGLGNVLSVTPLDGGASTATTTTNWLPVLLIGGAIYWYTRTHPSRR